MLCCVSWWTLHSRLSSRGEILLAPLGREEKRRKEQNRRPLTKLRVRKVYWRKRKEEKTYNTDNQAIQHKQATRQSTKQPGKCSLPLSLTSILAQICHLRFDRQELLHTSCLSFRRRSFCHCQLLTLSGQLLLFKNDIMNSNH